MSSVTYEWSMERRWYWQGKTDVLWEEPIPVPLFPPDFPHGLSWDRIRPPRRATGDRRPEPDLRDQWSATERLNYGKACLPVITITKRRYSELITFLFVVTSLSSWNVLCHHGVNLFSKNVRVHITKRNPDCLDGIHDDVYCWNSPSCIRVYTLFR
jgi:hypothetical protein